MIFKFLEKILPNRISGSTHSELEKTLGYRFQNPSHLTMALSHRSYVNSVRSQPRPESFERLEFLGDSVLNFIVTDYLYREYPENEEGRMSKMKSLVVSSRVLSLCAEQWNLGEHILLSRSEEKSGGRTRPSILADAYEAVVGAAYLDGGIPAATRLVYNSLMRILDEVLVDEDLVNYKSKLLEYTQACGMGAPSYEVLEESGPEHRKIFSIGVFAQGREWGKGEGNSKKSAEQAAARLALSHLKQRRKNPVDHESKSSATDSRDGESERN